MKTKKVVIFIAILIAILVILMLSGCVANAYSDPTLADNEVSTLKIQAPYRWLHWIEIKQIDDIEKIYGLPFNWFFEFKIPQGMHRVSGEIVTFQARRQVNAIFLAAAGHKYMLCWDQNNPEIWIENILSGEKATVDNHKENKTEIITSTAEKPQKDDEDLMPIIKTDPLKPPPGFKSWKEWEGFEKEYQ